MDYHECGTKQCHVYHPWLGIVNMSPIRMVMPGGCFVNFLPTSQGRKRLALCKGIHPQDLVLCGAVAPF